MLTCIGGDEPVLRREHVEQALRERRHRPLFVIDLGVPRNVDARVDELDGVYLYDVDDLGRVAEANAEERRREKVRAEAIVLEECQRFDGWLAALAAVPTIRDLRDRAERIRAREVERVAARLEASGVQREVLEALTRGLVNKLLHAPVARLRAQEDREQGLATLEAARALFALDERGRRGRAARGRRGLSGPVARLRIATRGSALALAQSGLVARARRARARRRDRARVGSAPRATACSRARSRRSAGRASS